MMDIKHFKSFAKNCNESILIKRPHRNVPWDNQPALGYDINSLDHNEIRKTISTGIYEKRIAAEVDSYSIEQMLKCLKLLKNGKVTNAAVVLFAKNVVPDYSQCSIKMTRYYGINNLAEIMDSKHVEGNAFKILLEASYFTMRHLPIASHFLPTQFQRVDVPALPVFAVREALINAITHRDYSNTSASISFEIFDDRLEIWSNGTLPPELKPKDLRKYHKSYPRNKRIANAFYSRGAAENAGIGTIRIIEDCRKQNLPEPKFIERSDGFVVIFWFKEPIGWVNAAMQREILKLLNISPMKAGQVAKKMRDRPLLTTVKQLLLQLEKAGFVQREGTARAVVWVLIKELS
jgi:ATP-dependent DNA helicase RecG